ncbi:MAG: hypothetical protein ACRCZF_06375 [Gemmataceae bacterium]
MPVELAVALGLGAASVGLAWAVAWYQVRCLQLEAPADLNALAGRTLARWLTECAMPAELVEEVMYLFGRLSLEQQVVLAHAIDGLVSASDAEPNTLRPEVLAVVRGFAGVRSTAGTNPPVADPGTFPMDR